VVRTFSAGYIIAVRAGRGFKTMFGLRISSPNLCGRCRGHPAGACSAFDLRKGIPSRDGGVPAAACHGLA